MGEEAMSWGFHGRGTELSALTRKAVANPLNHGFIFVLALIGGMFVLWGGRLAGGCTSGHLMSGMMQTAVNGFAIAAAALLMAVPTTILVYGCSS